MVVLEVRDTGRERRGGGDSCRLNVSSGGPEAAAVKNRSTLGGEILK